ncbi:hypothetical protein P280DRAFT_536216 [Massarina eburnea CBS 473.64]|uniref:Uncharacterized protein n=1 Tax=Massarina eburnea CBS 473.64 TaxID=1395130 RepID=A0A6A6RJ50_9PLEO|nr:hypothetical protein P280DRAFT_536216 [Massarina eburnea CBS 473.64]
MSENTQNRRSFPHELGSPVTIQLEDNRSTVFQPIVAGAGPDDTLLYSHNTHTPLTHPLNHHQQVPHHQSAHQQLHPLQLCLQQLLLQQRHLQSSHPQQQQPQQLHPQQLPLQESLRRQTSHQQIPHHSTSGYAQPIPINYTHNHNYTPTSATMHQYRATNATPGQMTYQQLLQRDINIINAELFHDISKSLPGCPALRLVREIDIRSAPGAMQKIIQFAQSDVQRLVNWRNCREHYVRLSKLNLDDASGAFQMMREQLGGGTGKGPEERTMSMSPSPQVIDLTGDGGHMPALASRNPYPQGANRDMGARVETPSQGVRHQPQQGTQLNPQLLHNQQYGGQHPQLQQPAQAASGSRKRSHDTLTPPPPRPSIPTIFSAPTITPQPRPYSRKRQKTGDELALEELEEAREKYHTDANRKASRIAYNRALLRALNGRGLDTNAFLLREYQEIRPTREPLNKYYTNLLANERLPTTEMEARTEKALVVWFAKERWWNYWDRVADFETAKKAMVESGWTPPKDQEMGSAGWWVDGSVGVSTGLSAAEERGEGTKKFGHLVTGDEIEEMRKSAPLYEMEVKDSVVGENGAAAKTAVKFANGMSEDTFAWLLKADVEPQKMQQVFRGAQLQNQRVEWLRKRGHGAA